MGWLSLLLPTLFAAALLYLPGLALLRVIGWGGKAAVFYAPAVGGCVVAVLTLLFGWVGVPWNPATALGSLAVVVTAWGGWEGWRRKVSARKALVTGDAGRDPAARRTLIYAAVGSTTFAFSYGWVVLKTVGAPGQIPTVGDAHFHLRAVQIIIDSGYASPLGPFPDLYPQLAAAPNYPTLWHSLVVAMTGLVPVVEATNAAALLVGLWLWPMGVAALASSLAPSLRSLSCSCRGLNCLGSPSIPLFSP